LSKEVANTSVFLYDRVWEKILWCVGKFDNIRDTFAACKTLSKGMGRDDAFMIPSRTEENIIYFDSTNQNRFCFQIKVEIKDSGSEREIKSAKESIN